MSNTYEVTVSSPLQQPSEVDTIIHILRMQKLRPGVQVTCPESHCMGVTGWDMNLVDLVPEPKLSAMTPSFSHCKEALPAQMLKHVLKLQE